jgi:Icc protein
MALAAGRDGIGYVTHQTVELHWATDVHLDLALTDQTEGFKQDFAIRPNRALLIAGDISEARDLGTWLRWIETSASMPVYFVLGNHDFYGSSVAAVQESIRGLVSATTRLHWLDEAGVVPLSSTTAVIGAGGWADGRYGDYANSGVRLNDHRRITDYLGLDHWGRARLMESLADAAVASLRIRLTQALESFPSVVVVTHYPPFATVCFHEGHPTNAAFLPFFSCQALGDMLLDRAGAYPGRSITVLCGHTHAATEAWILPNLRVIVGGATYGAPELQSPITIGP